MIKNLNYINIPFYKTEKGEVVTNLKLSYEIEGQKLNSAPIVVVCHALTGNSSVAGPNGWWAKLIGPSQTIDTKKYTILTFNIPGNGYDEITLSSPDIFTLKDVANLFLLGLKTLEVNEVDMLIGASLGGALAWQIAYISPKLSKKLIVIACDFIASDWLLAQTHIQSTILQHSSQPLRDARIHAMLCYRTPKSLNNRFASQKNEKTGEYKIIEWLNYHGETLTKRFQLDAYCTMTYLTGSINVSQKAEDLAKIQGQIHIVAIDSDLLFPYDRAEYAYKKLSDIKDDTQLYTIHSEHGHDAFLIEYNQLNAIVNKIVEF